MQREEEEQKRQPAEVSLSNRDTPITIGEGLNVYQWGK
jgi:hypothetical protein